jgi:hypothetical protein
MDIIQFEMLTFLLDYEKVKEAQITLSRAEIVAINAAWLFSRKTAELKQ